MRTLILLMMGLVFEMAVSARAENGHSWDQVEVQCMNVFNKSYGNDTDSLSTCRSNSGANVNYKLSVELWKSGVAGGALLGESKPYYQGALDAEVNFKNKDNSESFKWEKQRENSEAMIQEDNQKTLEKMPDCVLVGVANQLIESGKSCGFGISEASNSEKYQISYEYVCVTQTHNAKKCKTLSKKAYQNYLARKKEELKQ